MLGATLVDPQFWSGRCTAEIFLGCVARENRGGPSGPEDVE